MSLTGPSSVPLGFVVALAAALGLADFLAFADALGDGVLSVGGGVEPVSVPAGGAAVLSEDEPPQAASTLPAPSTSAPRSTVRRAVSDAGVRSSSCSSMQSLLCHWVPQRRSPTG